MPVRWPRPSNAAARFALRVDLPTPPLPLATAITRVERSSWMPFVRSVTVPRRRAVRALRSSGVITPNSSETRCTPSTGASAWATCCSKLERSGQPATVRAIPTVTSPPSTRTPRTMSSSTTLRFNSGSITCSSAFRIASREGSILRLSVAEDLGPKPSVEGGSHGTRCRGLDALGARPARRHARAGYFLRAVRPDSEQPLQRGAVSHREAVSVVVEVRIDVAGARPVLDPARPFVELGLRVVPVAPSRARVEADERPVGRQGVLLKRPARVVADHERDAVLTQQGVHRFDEPALVPELEAMPAGRELRQGGGEAVVVAPEVRRQLPEHGPELRRPGQRPDPLVEERDAGREVAQPLDVRRVAAHLHREDEPGRGLAHPVRDRALSRQPVEGRVDLDRVEAPGVEVEPAARRQPRGVEDAVAPVLVVPAGTADANP